MRNLGTFTYSINKSRAETGSPILEAAPLYIKESKCNYSHMLSGQDTEIYSHLLLLHISFVFPFRIYINFFSQFILFIGINSNFPNSNTVQNKSLTPISHPLTGGQFQSKLNLFHSNVVSVPLFFLFCFLFFSIKLYSFFIQIRIYSIPKSYIVMFFLFYSFLLLLFFYTFVLFLNLNLFYLNLGRLYSILFSYFFLFYWV